VHAAPLARVHEERLLARALSRATGALVFSQNSAKRLGTRFEASAAWMPCKIALEMRRSSVVYGGRDRKYPAT
jgi:hypothetical protein